jgi:hypothetical protein
VVKPNKPDRAANVWESRVAHQSLLEGLQEEQLRNMVPDKRIVCCGLDTLSFVDGCNKLADKKREDELVARMVMREVLADGDIFYERFGDEELVGNDLKRRPLKEEEHE